MNLAHLVKRTTDYEKQFGRVDFENGRQLQRLFRKVQQDLQTTEDAITRNEQHLERIQQPLQSYHVRRQQLQQRQQELAEQLQSRSEDQRCFDQERELHQVQFQLKAIERERRDYRGTRDTLRSWLLNLDQARGLLTMMRDSLQRNLDRLGIVLGEGEQVHRYNIIASDHYKDIVVECPACSNKLPSVNQSSRGGCGARLHRFKKASTVVAYRDKQPSWEQTEKWIRIHEQEKHQQSLIAIVHRCFAQQSAQWLHTYVRLSRKAPEDLDGWVTQDLLHDTIDQLIDRGLTYQDARTLVAELAPTLAQTYCIGPGVLQRLLDPKPDIKPEETPQPVGQQSAEELSR